MKIIITENQKSNLKTKLQNMVKDIGWKKTSIAVGGSENLAKLGFNSNETEFLDMFRDLNVVQSREYPKWTLFRYKKGNNIIVYDKKDDFVFISDKIWTFLNDGFGLKYDEIINIMDKWLDENYNLKGVKTIKNGQGAFLLRAS
jgi:hypothetical protein